MIFRKTGFYFSGSCSNGIASLVPRDALTTASFKAGAKVIGLAPAQGTDFDTIIGALVAKIGASNDGVAAAQNAWILLLQQTKSSLPGPARKS